MTEHTNSLVYKDDYLHPGDAFGDDPHDIINLAQATAMTGVGAAPSALLTATTLASDLSTEDLPVIRDAFLESLQYGSKPTNFLYLLSVTGALEFSFPQLVALKGVPTGPSQDHTEGDAFTHTLRVMDDYHELNPNDVIGLLGALSHDLGKACTPESEHPYHVDHTENGAESAQALADHLGLDDYSDAMTAAAKHHLEMADLLELEPAEAIRLVNTATDTIGADRLLTLLQAKRTGTGPKATVVREKYQNCLDNVFRVLSEVTYKSVCEKNPDMDYEHLQKKVRDERAHRLGLYWTHKTSE